MLKLIVEVLPDSESLLPRLKYPPRVVPLKWRWLPSRRSSCSYPFPELDRRVHLVLNPKTGAHNLVVNPAMTCAVLRAS